MFEKSDTFQRFSGQSSRVINLHLGHVPQLDDDGLDEKRLRRIAVAGAVLFHAILFLITVPASELKARQIGQPKQVYIVQQVRFKPPPPAQAQQIPKQREKRRVVPIPDPTPEEPEPIRTAEVEMPEIDYSVDDLVFGIPEAPPGLGIVGGEPMRLGGDIVPPEKLYYPQPKYTEEGRLGRIQGVVILEAIIDAVGDVNNVKVLKGLPMGLSESAVAAAREWKFKPATLGGKPVPVFLNLTIRFSLQ